MHDNISASTPTPWQQLKKRSLTVAAIRQVDRIAIERFGMHSLVLMENAAIASAQWMIEHYQRPRTVVLCGRGNNGGDGLAITRHLRLAGWPCQIVQLGPLDSLSPDARSNWNILSAKQLTDCLVADPFDSMQANTSQAVEQVTQWINRAEVVIDALLGSGAQGEPRTPMAQWIDTANHSHAARIAIDIPSGLDASTGQAAAVTFRAHATLTFVARKVGFDRPAAQEYLGQVEVLPIGIPVELIEELLV